MSLPARETTFTVKIEGSKSKRVFEGVFTFKLPNLRVEGEIEKSYARLTEGLNLRNDIDDLYFLVSYLHHTLSHTPDWWKDVVNLEIDDYNVVTEIYAKCKEFRDNRDKTVYGTNAQ